MSESFPAPTIPADSRAEVFLRYLDFFRSRVTVKIQAMSDADLRSSRLPSGWTPLELVKHLRYVELRWLEWGFEGRDVGDPWGDREGDRWSVGPRETPTCGCGALPPAPICPAQRTRTVLLMVPM